MTEREKIDWVYSCFEDEKSRSIFDIRKQFAFSNDYQYIDRLVTDYAYGVGATWYPEKEQELVKVLKERKCNLIIYGAGYYGKRVLNLCISHKLCVDYFCDTDKSKQHTKIQNIAVIPPEELSKVKKNHVIIVSPKFVYWEIIDRLIELGISSKDIYKYVDYAIVSSEEQYFDDEIVKLEDEEVFVDGGCFDLRTSKIFVNRMNDLGLKVKKIYAFEPDENNYQLCLKQTQGVDLCQISLIKAGLWNMDGYVNFVSEGTGGSHIALQGEKKVSIKTIALDSVINEKVTFIKMDIEGAEIEALKGAKNVILKYKPKLAICIYHKREDIWEIPYFIKSLVPEYKLYIRHYSNWTDETVLYAVC